MERCSPGRGICCTFVVNMKMKTTISGPYLLLAWFSMVSYFLNFLSDLDESEKNPTKILVYFTTQNWCKLGVKPA
jgi:hypothetical protein